MRSAGYTIGSTWHEGEGIKSLLAFRDHWNETSVEQVQNCDSLVIICSEGNSSMPELAMMAGFALACGVRVFWVGAPIKGLCNFRAVQQFSTAKDFEKQIVERAYSQPIASDAQLAA